MLGKAVDEMKKTPRRKPSVQSQSSGINPASLIGNLSTAISSGINANTDSNGGYSVGKEIAQDKQKRQSIGTAVSALASIMLSILAL